MLRDNDVIYGSEVLDKPLFSATGKIRGIIGIGVGSNEALRLVLFLLWV